MTTKREQGRSPDLMNTSVGSHGSGNNSFTANNDNLLAKLKK